MKKQKIAVGPGASSLMLIAVVLALTVLTVLTMISARNDESLSLRSVETRQQVYELSSKAERSLAKLDAILAKAGADNTGDAYLEAVKAALPEGMRLEGNQVLWEEKESDRQLECGVKLNDAGTFPRSEWTRHRLGEADIWEDNFSGFDDFGDGTEEDDIGENTETEASDAEDNSDLFMEDEEDDTL